jgi:hypothetical protein
MIAAQWIAAFQARSSDGLQGFPCHRIRVCSPEKVWSSRFSSLSWFTRFSLTVPGTSEIRDVVKSRVFHVLSGHSFGFSDFLILTF